MFMPTVFPKFFYFRVEYFYSTQIAVDLYNRMLSNHDDFIYGKVAFAKQLFCIFYSSSIVVIDLLDFNLFNRSLKFLENLIKG